MASEAYCNNVTCVGTGVDAGDAQANANNYCATFTPAAENCTTCVITNSTQAGDSVISDGYCS
jgi:hypothetical protein